MYIKMRQLFKDFIFVYIIICLLTGVFIFAASVSAATDIPRIEPYVNDFAGLLSPQDELKLNLLADDIENRTTFEIAIVTVQGTGGQDRLEFANMIGDQNGVGKKDSDNGIVVLWSVEDDQGGAIATGRGSESFITDSTTGTIGRAARPYFDKGDFYGGMNYIVVELDKAIVKHQAIPINGNNSTGTSGEGDDAFNAVMIWILFGALAIVIFKLISSFYRSDSDPSDYYNSSDDGDEKGYYRKQVYKRHGNWYNKEADRSYLTAAAAAAALATMNTDSDSDSDDDSSSSSSSGGFSGGSFGGGGFGGGGGKF